MSQFRYEAKPLDKYYPKETINEREKRENITFLNINNKNLAGHLDLHDFASLESLSCLGNKLTSLDLSSCSNLIKLNCSSNKLTSTEFLQEIPNPKKLEVLRINKNEGLKENLNFLSLFTGIKELNVEDCPLVGSLEPLKSAKKLKKIFISRTHISKGLEYLPKSCQKLYCDYDYQYKSIKIVDELSKFAEESLVFVGQSDTTDPNSQLYTQVGGVIAIASPFVETITSYINDHIYDLLDNYHELLGIIKKIKKSKLGSVNKVLNDLRSKTKKFLKKYDEDKNEVIDINELIKGRIKFATDLSKENLGEGSSQLGDIVLAMKKLEEEIVKYQQGYSFETIESESDLEGNENNNSLEKNREAKGTEVVTEDQQSEIQTQIVVSLHQRDLNN
nr:11752_t:CDS:2 [Entrophospora candida]